MNNSTTGVIISMKKFFRIFVSFLLFQNRSATKIKLEKKKKKKHEICHTISMTVYVYIGYSPLYKINQLSCTNSDASREVKKVTHSQNKSITFKNLHKTNENKSFLTTYFLSKYYM